MAKTSCRRDNYKTAVLGLVVFQLLWIVRFVEKEQLVALPLVVTNQQLQQQQQGKTKSPPPEVGSTAYFQWLCNRGDVFAFPLECPNATTRMSVHETTVLSSRLDCYRQTPKTAKSVNFYAFAHGEQFQAMLAIYAFFALQTHPDAVVEMVVTNRTEFIDRFATELSWLLLFVDETAVCVRNVAQVTQQRTKVTNTWRYLEPPVRRATFTYIGDVDIFLTESVLDPKRMEQMQHFNLSYSNVIRPNTTRLTGVMLLRTQDFYTESLLTVQRELNALGNDEEFLYRLVEKAGLGLPGTNHSHDPFAVHRPVHGLHLSTNRGPGKRLCLGQFDDQWCRVLNTPWLHEFLCLQQDPSKSIFSQAAEKIRQQMVSNMTLVQPANETRRTVCK